MAPGQGVGVVSDLDAADLGSLELRPTADGSLSLWSSAFAEAFHCGNGAWSEAQAKFVAPAELDRWPPGTRLPVLDVGVGLAYNSAALLEAAEDRGVQLQWWGLELDPRPLQLALADAGFRRLWRPATLGALEQLQRQGQWEHPAGRGRWWLGDGRQTVALAARQAAEWGGCLLVLHDAFSPGRCPQLWSLDFLTQLAALLAPQGRLLTYCAAAAVRRGLQMAGLQLASLRPPGTAGSRVGGAAWAPGPWSLGTVASPSPLVPGPSSPYRPLNPMELDHLTTRAASPYRDPSGQASRDAILAERRQRQALEGGSSTSAWRRRWQLERPPGPAEHAR